MLATAIVDMPARDLRNRELLSSVAISGTCARGCAADKRVFGTGEIVARRNDGRLIVLTARHVIDDMSDPRVYMRNGAPEGTHITAAVRDVRGRPAGLVAQSADSDLALVVFRPAPTDSYDVAALANDATMHSGDVVGGPYGALWTVSPYKAVAPDGDATLVSCDTCGPGDSGGGVFDGRGALEGILVSQQVFVKGNEPVELAARSTRFKIVPLPDVRAFVAVLPREALPVAASDPWTRFERGPLPDVPAPRAAPELAPGDPWVRFDRRGPAIEP